MITDNIEVLIIQALLAEDDVTLLSLLAHAYQRQKSHRLTLAYSLCLMQAPHHLPDQASALLPQLFGTRFELRAALITCYIHTHLEPTTIDFLPLLNRYNNSASAHYMLSLFHDYQDNREQAQKSLKHSLELNKFPYNLNLYTQYHPELAGSVQQVIRKEISARVIDKSFELSSPARSIPAYIKETFYELIYGFKMTSPNWQRMLNRWN